MAASAPRLTLDGMAEEQPPGVEGSSESGDGTADDELSGSNGPSPSESQDVATDDTEPKRRLCRSSTDKVIAGVAGGIGAYFGIDSVIVRIAFIVLTFLGGAGPFLYLIGWLVLPREDAPSVIANALAGDSEGRFRSLAAVVLIGLGLLITANLSGDLFDLFVNVWSIAPYLALILIAAGVTLVVWPGPTRRHKSTPARSPASPAPAPGVPPTSSAFATSAATPPTTAGPEWPAAPPPPHPPPGAVPSPAPRRRRGRSVLGSLTVAALLVYSGAAVILERLDVVEMDVGAFFAIALAITGTGLLVSAFTGPARGLIFLGAALVPVALLFASTDVKSWRGLGEVRVAPASLDELEQDYEHGIGRLVVELEDLQLDGRDRSVDVSLGMGEVVVYVPDNIRFSADIEVGVGAITERWGYMRSGDAGVWHWERHDSTGGIGVGARVVLPAVGDPDGELDFDIDLGMGEVEIVTVPSRLP